jgi:hypothetical protein
MIKLLLLSFLLFSCACQKDATSKVVKFSGKVISAKDSLPIANVSIQLTESQPGLFSGIGAIFEGLSDSLGNFSCKNTLLLDRSHSFDFYAVGWLGEEKYLDNQNLNDEMYLIQTMWPDTFTRNE